MYRWFIMFLIVLLPLRGWTAERMVFPMAGGTPVAAAAMDLEMSPECALHMQMAAADQPAGHHTDHKACESCQLCMPLVAVEAPLAMALVASPQALPFGSGCHFVSADAARDVKPPIS